MITDERLMTEEGLILDKLGRLMLKERRMPEKMSDDRRTSDERRDSDSSKSI